MRKSRRMLTAVLCATAMIAGAMSPAAAHDPAGDQAESLKGRFYDGHVDDVSPGGVPMTPMSDIRCEDGMAGIFPCHKVDLASFIPLPMIESTFVNDVWGWEDSRTGMQLAIVGTFEGTAFIDVTDGLNPVYLGTLESALPGDFFNIWGDVRVFEDVAYIGTEVVNFDDFSGNGIQIVDLTQFRGATEPIDVVEANRITDMTNSHNLSVNVDTGRLYVVGSVIGLSECQVSPPPGFPPFFNGNGGALIYDVATNPLNPQFLGCMLEDGYIHDIQCVVYSGPDPDYQGSEICIGSNEDTLTIYDATDATAPEVLSKLTYLDMPFFDPERGVPNYYTHQGWLSEDQTYFFLGDELDEFFGGIPERSTYIWDMTDLDNAQLIGVHTDGNESIDHNMFVHDGLLFQANYSSGLWIYDTWKADQGRVKMRGFFDVFPVDDRTEFFGSWGAYPYFGDGKVVVTSSDEGVFVLQSRAKSAENNNGKGRIR